MNTTLRSRFFAILMSLAIALSFMGLDFAVVSADDTPSEPATATVAVRVNDENNKPAIGSMVAHEIGVDMLRGACKHFNEWLTKLEGLG